MPNYSKIILIGHLGKDPELAFTPKGMPILKLRVAVSTYNGKEKVTSWYQADWFGDKAQAMQQNLYKGQAVLVEGDLTMREWQNNKGEKVITPTIHVARAFPLVWKERQADQEPTTQAESASQPDDPDLPF